LTLPLAKTHVLLMRMLGHRARANARRFGSFMSLRARAHIFVTTWVTSLLQRRAARLAMRLTVAEARAGDPAEDSRFDLHYTMVVRDGSGGTSDKLGVYTHFETVGCLLCTVTFHANHAHNLTRSP
jgi:hypothetical protein